MTLVRAGTFVFPNVSMASFGRLLVRYLGDFDGANDPLHGRTERHGVGSAIQFEGHEMTGRRRRLRFRIRDLLIATLAVAVAISATAYHYRRGKLRMSQAEDLQAWGIIALEKSQLPTMFEPVTWTPPNGEPKEIEIPIFNDPPSSMGRTALGDELFVDYDAVLVRYCHLPMPELESKIAGLGQIQTIYISPLSGLERSQVDLFQRRFPGTQITVLDLPVFIPGVDDLAGQ